MAVSVVATTDTSRNFLGDVSPLLDCEICFSFLKDTRRRPDTNGRGNVLFYLGRSTFTPKMGYVYQNPGLAGA